jgi:hypothetical protein
MSPGEGADHRGDLRAAPVRAAMELLEDSSETTLGAAQ